MPTGTTHSSHIRTFQHNRSGAISQVKVGIPASHPIDIIAKLVIAFLGLRAANHPRAIRELPSAHKPADQAAVLSTVRRSLRASARSPSDLQQLLSPAMHNPLSTGEDPSGDVCSISGERNVDSDTHKHTIFGCARAGSVAGENGAPVLTGLTPTPGQGITAGIASSWELSTPP